MRDRDRVRKTEREISKDLQAFALLVPTIVQWLYQTEWLIVCVFCISLFSK